ncbi:hypothetical protein RND81_03G236400 [Saponaria officinalis]|uniref:J domain-containing protein n=1 Tax=Saponaria officinalis TaxID=3572 RepID=A0AAW1MBT7_SAPOF
MDHHHPYTAPTATTTVHNRAEAERLLSISSKLLHSRDLAGAREFALLAQETDPLLPESDQILAITDVLLASEQRVDDTHPYDWHTILQTTPGSDPTQLESNYRRLSLLLDPDKNKYPLAGSAFKLVSDGWAALSDPTILKKLPIRRNARDNARDEASFWTACPYCFVLYEYLSVYKDCCLRCRKCRRAFHGAELPSLPPLVPGDGNRSYYSWGFFPIGISCEGRRDVGFPNWMPGIRPLSACNGVNGEEPWTE